MTFTALRGVENKKPKLVSPVWDLNADVVGRARPCAENQASSFRALKLQKPIAEGQEGRELSVFEIGDRARIEPDALQGGIKVIRSFTIGKLLRMSARLRLREYEGIVRLSYRTGQQHGGRCDMMLRQSFRAFATNLLIRSRGMRCGSLRGSEEHHLRRRP